MKLISIWPALFFAGGILLSGACAGNLPANPSPRFCLLAAAFFLLCAWALLGRWLLPALLFGSAAWFCLGFAAAGFARISQPANLASALIESSKIESSVALRWRGRLREDPLQLPWGTRYEIDLGEVESGVGIRPISGGLRVTSYRDESSTAHPPSARAGDAVEVLVRAQPVSNFNDPGSFDFAAYLALQGVNLEGTLRNDQLLTVLGHPPLRVSDRLARIRGRLLDSIDELFSSRPDRAALARAMLLGDRTFVDHDRVAEFQQTGVYHVLVLAGLHIGALTAFFIWCGRRLRLKLIPRTLLTLAALAMYAGIVQDRPPILRAALMAAIYLTARLLYRRMDLLNVSALAALIILAARPLEIRDPSFLLSFAAVGVIGALALPWIARTSQPYLRGLVRLGEAYRDPSSPPRVIQFRIELRAAAAWIAARFPRWAAPFAPDLLAAPIRGALYLWDLIVLSFILQLGMLPLLAYYFHRVTLAGPLANIPAVLLTCLIVPVGFLTLGVSLIWHGLALLLAKVLGMLLTWLDFSVQWFARWHGTSYRIPGPSPFVILAFAASVVLLSVAMGARRGAWRWAGTLVLLGLAAVIATYPFAAVLNLKNLELTVLDIGQGDSLFLTFPGGHTMLVDAGGLLGSFHAGGMSSGIDVGEDVVSPYLWSRGIKRIEVVALTHAHQDHLGGLPAVLENFRVDELWVGRDINSAAYRHVLAVAKERGVRVVHLKQGDSFTRGDVSGKILWPEEIAEGNTAENDDSIVMRLSEGSQSMLLTGDIERPSERQILADDQPVSAGFLKVGHHGSRTSTTDQFLAAVHPEFAAISVGRDNGFGHPSPEVVDRLETSGVHLYRTDRDGAITAAMNGRSFDVTTFLHPSAPKHSQP